MALELLAEARPVAGASDLFDGWRGLLDFGELWSEQDEALWPSDSGPLPRGRPLTYGCEVTRRHHDELRDSIQVWSLDEPAAVMTPGASFTLRDGDRARAVGELL